MAKYILTKTIIVRNWVLSNCSFLTAPETPWAAAYGGKFGRVIFGHDARRKIQIYEHATGLDSGTFG